MYNFCFYLLRNYYIEIKFMKEGHDRSLCALTMPYIYNLDFFINILNLYYYNYNLVCILLILYCVVYMAFSKF